jgi:hypothetical protein
MIYVKSVLAGILALVIAVFSTIVAILVYDSRSSESPTTIGWDPHAASRSPGFWAIIALIFAVGFFWEFRRLSQ